MDLLDDDAPAGTNTPEFSVSELSSAIKRMVEGEFPFVRVRGEVGRVARPGSGHLYFDLKDERATLAAIVWKGQAGRLTVRPEEGMEVVATGKLTTFPGQSKYQMTVEDIAPAGAGALMAQLEARRAKLAGEGVFDAARKQAIPYLPEVIAVVTSPSGAVIRDILHRLRDRFPRRVIVWPVAVQGQACAPDVARAIAGLNALEPGGPVPRPDLIIVARGGGSIEDLWGFNEEIVVRAVAASRIPIISAVGHETDTTLIDLVADLRAPTPTAAAEMAVPVRADLALRVAGLSQRGAGALRQGVGSRRQRLTDLARALPRGEAILAQAAQRLDVLAARLPAALRGVAVARRVALADLTLRPGVLVRAVQAERRRLEAATAALAPALARSASEAHGALGGVGRRLDGAGARPRQMAAIALGRLTPRLAPAAGRQVVLLAQALARLAPRLTPLAERAVTEARADAARTVPRLTPALPLAVLARLREGVSALDRLRETLGYEETLRRGYAVVRVDGRVVTLAEAASRAAALDIQFADGHVAVKGAPRRASRGEVPPEQGSLL